MNPDPSDPEFEPIHDWTWKNIDEDLDIIFFFAKDVKVVIDYYQIGTSVELKARHTNNNVSGAADYSMPVSHMNAIANTGGGVWNYAACYSLDGGATVLQGAPPAPVFAAAQMTGDKRIILYFTEDYRFTVRFREYKGANLLFDENNVNIETYLLPTGVDVFDPMAKTEIANAVNNGTKSITGKEYKIYRGWSDNGGATIHLDDPPPEFTELDGSKDIILYFSASYVVTEQFHAVDSPYTELLGDLPNTVLGGDPFTGNPLKEIFDGANRWEYVGYKIGTDQEDPVLQGAPDPVVISAVWSDVNIIYCYEKKEANTTDVTVTERFRELGNTGHVLAGDVINKEKKGSVFAGARPGSFTEGTPPDDVTYTYWGYQIDGETPVEGAFPGITADGPRTVTYLYYPSGSPPFEGFILHLRQVVLDPAVGLQIPYAGYFNLINNGLSRNITTDSNTDDNDPPFRKMFVTIDDADRVLDINDVIPQYYKYAGFAATETEPDAMSPHVPPAGSGPYAAARVDFTSESEWWVTVYITPNGFTGLYEWGFKTNDFGVIYPDAAK